MALMATQPSVISMLPKDVFHSRNDSTTFSKRSATFRFPQPVGWPQLSQSRLLPANEEQLNDTKEIAIAKMKKKKILLMKMQLLQMQAMN
jgi:hypothetical protein